MESSLESNSIETIANESISDQARLRYNRLFELFETTLKADGKIVPIGETDQFVNKSAGAFFLKHDVHDLDLDNLIRFARDEIQLGVRATYFFMPNGHPRTSKVYQFDEQIEAMKEISAMGHELALHIDPYFQLHQRGLPLRKAMEEILAEFFAFNIKLNIGNMHGNSHFKHPDNNGFGTSFDLLEEVARQPDYPQLEDVPKESADVIRKNRISLKDFEFTYWADMPVWSSNHGFVGTNFMTDNLLAKKGTIELLLRGETTGAYFVAQSQPPGSRNLNGDGVSVDIPNSLPYQSSSESHRLDFFCDELTGFLSKPKEIEPLQILVHPEFYI